MWLEKAQGRESSRSPIVAIQPATIGLVTIGFYGGRHIDLAKSFDERMRRARAPPGCRVDASSLQVCQGTKSVAIAPRGGIPIPDLMRTLTAKVISAPCRGGGIVGRCPWIRVALIPFARPAGLSNVSAMVTCITDERRIGQIPSIRDLLNVGVWFRRSIGIRPIAPGIPSGDFPPPG